MTEACAAGAACAVNTEELAALLPHKGKMFLLSRVLRCDLASRSLWTEYDITRECLFYREELGGVPSWLGFELVAQSIAVLSGLRRREQGLPPRLGFILSVTDMVLSVPAIPEGSAARIEIKEEAVMDAVYSFRGSVFSNGGEAVRAKLTVMEADDISVITKRSA